jgi:hypothetical protein
VGPFQFTIKRLTGSNACALDSALPAYLALFLVREMPTDTPSAVALAYVAPRVRFSLRAITIGFVFWRASDFNRRTSSFIHGRTFVVVAIPFSMPPSCERIGRHYN